MLRRGTTWPRRALLCGVLGLVACGRGEAKLHVLAAASLTDVLPEVAESWAAKGGMPVELVFDGTSRLATQIEGGAPADVFFAADRAWMDALDGKGFVLDGTRHDLLGNRLVLVVPADATDPPATADDLRSIGRLALAGASVPAGKYARAALASLGVADTLAAKIVEGDDVRTALAWVANGEADAAIVYATDASIEPRVKVALELPAASHPPIVYPIAVLAHGKHTDAATRFVEHMRSDIAQAIFREAGFAPPP